nr:uncharacterized protein LOC121117603 [Lepeophtheirus salmonis]
MPKTKYPPQGGEKHLCFTLFCTMLLSVISAVAIIYSIVIIYIPSKTVLESTIALDSKMCTTLSNDRNLSGIDTCAGWSSCEEWCLSKSNKECSHVWAAARNLGTEIDWTDCDIIYDNEEESLDTFVNHRCNVLEDLPEMNCKLYPYEKDTNGNTGDKNRCIRFNNIQISCEAGICKNITAVYKYGVCNCNRCDMDVSLSPHITPKAPITSLIEHCPLDIINCTSVPDSLKNESQRLACSDVKCSSCKQICQDQEFCFDLRKRRDPTIIGTDIYRNPVKRYYTCEHGYCSEIYDLKCERRCDDLQFNTTGKNSFIFNGEKIIMAYCRKRSTAKISKVEGQTGKNTLIVACTNISIDRESNMMITRDCVNGTWLEDNYNGGKVNYSQLVNEYSFRREIFEHRAHHIEYEPDITFLNRTKLKINIEGCVNTLSKECTDFYENYGKDGRNYTSRAIYPCYYDPFDPDFVVINFDPDKTLMLLILFSAVPGGILILSCTYMCGCSRFIHVADDGHMRLMCCGKYVTEIGNVPIWNPPSPRSKKVVKDEQELILVENNIA